MSAENFGEGYEGPNLFLIPNLAEGDVIPPESEVVQIRTGNPVVRLGGDVVKVAISSRHVDSEYSDPFDGAEKPFQMVNGRQVRMSLSEMPLLDRNRT